MYTPTCPPRHRHAHTHIFQRLYVKLKKFKESKEKKKHIIPQKDDHNYDQIICLKSKTKTKIKYSSFTEVIYTLLFSSTVE